MTGRPVFPRPFRDQQPRGFSAHVASEIKSLEAFLLASLSEIENLEVFLPASLQVPVRDIYRVPPTHQEKKERPTLGYGGYITRIGPSERGGIYNVTEGGYNTLLFVAANYIDLRSLLVGHHRWANFSRATSQL